ncbi:MAG: DUF1353 domain-containing protein [Opitutia bacterium]|jgi:hypothetical protein
MQVEDVYFHRSVKEQAKQITDFGVFVSPLDARLTTDRRSRTITLLSPLIFVDCNEVEHIVPEGFISDGASIPRGLWWLFGHPFGGPYRRGAVLHDFQCVMKALPWDDVHNRFYRTMRADGTSRIKAGAMHQGVFSFGPRWPSDNPSANEFRDATVL